MTNIEYQIKVNDEEIIKKHQQIANENDEIKCIKNNIDNKCKLITDTQHLIEQKQSQLQVRNN